MSLQQSMGSIHETNKQATAFQLYAMYLAVLRHYSDKKDFYVNHGGLGHAKHESFMRTNGIKYYRDAAKMFKSIDFLKALHVVKFNDPSYFIKMYEVPHPRIQTDVNKLNMRLDNIQSVFRDDLKTAVNDGFDMFGLWLSKEICTETLAVMECISDGGFTRNWAKSENTYKIQLGNEINRYAAFMYRWTEFNTEEMKAILQEETS